MRYERVATRQTPALIIYLLDMSASMNEPIGDGRGRRIDLVNVTLIKVIREMARRAIKGSTPAARYRVAAFAYNDTVRDVYGGIRPITDLVQLGVPAMTPSGPTETAAAFLQAEQLLIRERGNLRDCPAPLICHLTDGSYTGDSPVPVVQRIQQMTFPDGPVLVENIFFNDSALRVKVDDPFRWRGVATPDDVRGSVAGLLFDLSSVIPDSYLKLFVDRGYSIRPGSRMMFSGETPEMLEAAFTMSGMTPIA
ncbi:vWA domain-containing protein [Dactylosporangium sp. NPDC049140]|uniref:vWA domain-containing protein n=1 Tax=Dactylosporangium sp. NPDC049140 TaxID=3155647 RepID=UPI0033CF1B8D